jgi:hypothetical protein
MRENAVVLNAGEDLFFDIRYLAIVVDHQLLKAQASNFSQGVGADDVVIPNLREGLIQKWAQGQAHVADFDALVSGVRFSRRGTREDLQFIGSHHCVQRTKRFN